MKGPSENAGRGGVLLTGLRSPAVFLPLAEDPPTIAGTNRYRLGTIRMQISAERRVAARREAVWAALNDLDTLCDCIPGCLKLQRLGDNVIAAEVMARVGPVATKFQGTLTMSDVDPPSGCTLNGKGQGGAAGFASGWAKLQLLPDENRTMLKYEVDVTVGGKLAQIGSRLIDAAALKMADDFFERLAMRLAHEETVAIIDEPKRVGLHPRFWVPLLIASVLLMLYAFSKL